jgi:hypothetical protein
VDRFFGLGSLNEGNEIADPVPAAAHLDLGSRSRMAGRNRIVRFFSSEISILAELPLLNILESIRPHG